VAWSNIRTLPISHELILLLGASAFLASSFSFGDVYLYHAVAFISLLYVCFRGLLPELIRYDLREHWPWFAFITYSLASVLWATNTSNALRYNAYLLSGTFLILFFAYFIKKFKLHDLMIRILGFLFICHLVLGTIEILTPLRWFISEYSTLNEFFLRKSYDFPAFFHKYPTSFFWHQNNCALVTLLGLPFVFRQSNRSKFLIGTLAYFIIFMSGSKSIIFLSFLYGCFSLIKSFSFKKPSLRNIALSGCLGILMIFTIGLFGNSEQRNELSQVTSTVASYVSPSIKFASHEILGTPFDFEEIHINVRERYIFMDGAIDLYKSSPFLGVGAGSHIGVPFTYKTQTIYLDSLHNFWLEIFVLYGVGSIFFFYGLFHTVKNSRTYRHSLILLILGIPVLSSAIYFLPMWLLVSLANADKNNSPRNSI
jgi:hypothetical protein